MVNRVMETNDGPFLSLMRGVDTVPELNALQWEGLLRRAQGSALLPRIAVKLKARNLFPILPLKVRERLEASLVIAAKNEVEVRWEVDRILWSLREIDVPIVLLKGAAYVMADLSPAPGRLASDVDVLVPKSALESVERALVAAGWKAMKLDAYDQRYYRDWMHEIPPLRHRDRNSVIDVHHTILPVTARLRPNAESFRHAARPLGFSRLMVLEPVDMVLHAMVHLFYDGDLDGRLRELLDLDDLLRQFAVEPEFWDRLVPRAVEQELIRPLFYGLRHCRRILATPVPDDVLAASIVGAPSRPVIFMMDWLVGKVILPQPPEQATLALGLARFVLYVRSHWITMPPFLLVRHLTRKGFNRMKGKTAKT